jgi:hypothetical protein
LQGIQSFHGDCATASVRFGCGIVRGLRHDLGGRFNYYGAADRETLVVDFNFHSKNAFCLLLGRIDH